MNRPTLAKKVAVISALVEGCSVRSTSRMTGVANGVYARRGVPACCPVQLTTDGHKMYLTAVPDAFSAGVDYAHLVKVTGTIQKRRSGTDRTAICTACEQHRTMGNPDATHIITSYIERQNLAMRMQMRRSTR